jgi:hypothetical protein
MVIPVLMMMIKMMLIATENDTDVSFDNSDASGDDDEFSWY